MMNDPVLYPLSILAKSKWTIETERLLHEHPFIHLDELTTWLTSVAVQYITRKNKGQSFKTLIKSHASLDSIIEAGNYHYYNVFRTAQLFGENNEKHEETTPLSRLIKELYNRLSGRNGKYKNEIVIYDDLAKQFINEIGRKLIAHPEINQYEHWKRIRSLFVDEWRLPDDWISNIPISHLKKEAHKFNFIPANVGLSQLADFGPTRKRNRPALNEYLQLIKATSDPTTLKKLVELTDGNEYISFKKDRYFELALLEALDSGELLTFVDDLRYPIVQDHAFIFVSSLAFYEQLTISLAKPNFKSKTPKLVLLFIILKNYLEFVFNIGYELSNYESGRPYSDHPNLKQIQFLAEEIKIKWLDETLPNSFRKIIDAVMPRGKLDNDLGLLLVEWFSEQLPEEHALFVQQIRNDSIRGMDAAFKASINMDISNSEFLIEQVRVEIYNWKYFDLLSSTDFAENNTNGIGERIIKRHLEYLRSPKFKWNNPNKFNDYFINQAYHFSILLLVYPDAHEYWNTLYNEFRIYHEGWNYNVGSDYNQFRKECYIFCTGIGIAYFLGTKNRKEEGEPIILAIFPKVLSQIRQNKRYTQFYLTPLCFVFEYFKKFDPSKLSGVVLILIEKIDSIKLLLNLLGDLLTFPAATVLPLATKEQLRLRIENDFFIINDRPDMMALREEKQIYMGLKDKLFKALE